MGKLVQFSSPLSIRDLPVSRIGIKPKPEVEMILLAAVFAAVHFGDSGLNALLSLEENLVLGVQVLSVVDDTVVLAGIGVAVAEIFLLPGPIPSVKSKAELIGDGIVTMLPKQGVHE